MANYLPKKKYLSQLMKSESSESFGEVDGNLLVPLTLENICENTNGHVRFDLDSSPPDLTIQENITDSQSDFNGTGPFEVSAKFLDFKKSLRNEALNATSDRPPVRCLSLHNGAYDVAKDLCLKRPCNEDVGDTKPLIKAEIDQDAMDDLKPYVDVVRINGIKNGMVDVARFVEPTDDLSVSDQDECKEISDPLPTLSTFSSFADMEGLTNALPSNTSSFSSLLNCLSAKDERQICGGDGTPRKSSVLTDRMDQGNDVNRDVSCPGSMWSTPMQQHFILKADENGGLVGKQNFRARVSSKYSPDGGSEVKVHIKREHADGRGQDHRPLVTTSGRNRGSGKVAEPKYSCQVCGDVAAGYHCGAYVCEACKVQMFQDIYDYNL